MNLFNPLYSVEGTAGAATGTTAVALPGGLTGQENYLTTIVVKNRGAVEIRMKKSALASGPDASNNTDGKGIVIPAGQTLAYKRSRSELYIYMYSASNCDYAVEVGEGF